MCAGYLLPCNTLPKPTPAPLSKTNELHRLRRIRDRRGRLQPSVLAKFCQRIYSENMSTMNISLPDTLKSFVDEQVSQRGYGTSSEYVRELIRKDQERQQLRGLLLAGATSTPAAPADGAYFDNLRNRVHQITKSGTQG
mgnify:CR=1 FL=1